MNQRLLLVVFLWLFLSSGFAFAQQTQPKELPAGNPGRNIIVIIDPGHGGSDPGNLSGQPGMKHEKYLNLQIAKKLGGYITQYVEGVKVLYTRETDKRVTLDEIVDFANNNKGDYFISIHCNSNPNRGILGTRTHIHSHNFKASKTLATMIEKQFAQRAGRTSRGVMDARDRGYNLQVLQYTEMPGVLVEFGFMSNPIEERYLNSINGQEILASAVYRAFRDFVAKKHNLRNKESRETIYKVQIMASTKPVSLEYAKFKNLGMRVEEHKVENSNSAFKYRYMVGREYEHGLASKLADKVKKMGFEDAFVIKMTD